MVEEKVRSFFLNEVDGLEDNAGLMIIGSTNYLEKLDPSITKRPSRFDRKYHFTLPEHAQRVLYADYWRGKLAKNQHIDFPEGLSEAIATITSGLSFAYMKEIFISSLLSIVGAKRVGAKEPEGLNELDGEIDGESNRAYDRFRECVLWRTVRKQVQVIRHELGATEAESNDFKGEDKSSEEADGVKTLIKNFAGLLAKYNEA